MGSFGNDVALLDIVERLSSVLADLRRSRHELASQHAHDEIAIGHDADRVRLAVVANPLRADARGKAGALAGRQLGTSCRPALLYSDIPRLRAHSSGSASVSSPVVEDAFALTADLARSHQHCRARTSPHR